MLPSPIKEDLLHYVWRTKSFDYSSLSTTNGQKLEIRQFGFMNTHAGPDFSSGRIKIEGIEWSGNIEMHVFSSQWFQHKHDEDPAYNNVILHVVYEHDREVRRKNGETIPVLELKSLIPTHLKSRYLQLMQNENWIPCAHLFPEWPDERKKLYLSRLMVDRLERKILELESTFQYTLQDWEQTTFILLAKYLGSQINGLPMEILAKNLDVKLFAKNKGKLHISAALVFGQAGFLISSYKEEYPDVLRKEYMFLAKKYNLTPMDLSIWKFGRLRPPNFPTIRLAQLAFIMGRAGRLFNRILTVRDHSGLSEIFSGALHHYWDDHYRFGKKSTVKKKSISANQQDLLLINMVSPLLFFYGVKTGNQVYKDRAVSILENTRAEKNTIVKHWKKLNMPADHAGHTQALLQLKNEYCDHQRCLECAIGNYILR